MVVKFNDPIIHEKVIAHADYKVPNDLPPKPSNPNALPKWREDCKSIKMQTSPHNARLYKKIWEELNSSTESSSQ